RGHVRDEHLGRGAGDARHAVVLREPEPRVAEPLREACQLDRVAQRLRRRRTRADRRQIEDGERERHAHTAHAPSVHASSAAAAPRAAFRDATSSSTWRKTDAGCAPSTATSPSNTNVGTARTPILRACSNASCTPASPSSEARYACTRARSIPTDSARSASWSWSEMSAPFVKCASKSFSNSARWTFAPYSRSARPISRCAVSVLTDSARSHSITIPSAAAFSVTRASMPSTAPPNLRARYCFSGTAFSGAPGSSWYER